MIYTARGYAREQGLSLLNMFKRAWKVTQKRSPGSYSIAMDVKEYEIYGAVPRYVQDFLHMVETGEADLAYRIPFGYVAQQ